MTPSIAKRLRVRDLNDQFRAKGPVSSARWVLTPGVSERGIPFTALCCRKVANFDAFTPDNDPHGEHDFGAFQVAGERLFWKIDYYDQALDGGSPDPADPAVTCRVLTIMLASEY